MKHLLILFFGLSFFVLSAQSQPDSKKIDLKKGSISEKFDEIYKKSGKYKEYKVIKANLIFQLKKQVLDSLTKEKTALKAANTKIEKLTNDVAQVQNELNSAKQNISGLEANKDSISFFGQAVKKETYNIIMWLLVAGLFFALLFFIYKFNNSNSVTKSANQSLKSLENEFNTFRAASIEREQLLKRQLLDEQKKHQ